MVEDDVDVDVDPSEHDPEYEHAEDDDSDDDVTGTPCVFVPNDDVTENDDIVLFPVFP